MELLPLLCLREKSRRGGNLWNGSSGHIGNKVGSSKFYSSERRSRGVFEEFMRGQNHEKGWYFEFGNF